MLDILFGWRKASKCKKLIKRVQCRLKLLKNKRSSILRQLKEDVAQLIKIGYEDVAFNRVDQIFKDESIMTVYELLDNFCEFIILHLSYIRRHKDCPNDINEAVSSLIFASARCGDLPELRAIRKLFGERYGEKFEKTALEMLPGNLVNSQVTENLSIACVTDEMRQRLVDQIARDYCLRQEILALEYPVELQQEVNKVEEDQVEASSANEIEGKSIYIDAASTGIMISTSMDSSVVLLSSPDTLESPIHIREVKPKNIPVVISLHELKEEKAGTIYIATPEWKEESKTVVSSPESLPQIAEEMIVYLDEIEELQSSIEKEGSCQDQSVFKFKSSPLQKNAEIGDNSIVEYMDQYESRVRDARSRSIVKEMRKRCRRRSTSLENSRIEDMDCFVFYDGPNRIASRHRHRISPQSKHQKNNPAEKVEIFCAENNKQGEGCCLNQPCYFCVGNDSDDQEISPWKQKIECTVICELEQNHISNQFLHLDYSRIGESGTQIQSLTAPQMPKTRCSKLARSEHNHNINPTFQPGEALEIMKGNENAITSPRSDVVSNVSYSMPSKLAGKVKPPYLRNLTMPQERARDGQLDNVARSKSFPVQSPTHVHPKLPDYDEIAAKFMALKKEHTQNRAS